jgi:hypothetical protein
MSEERNDAAQELYRIAMYGDRGNSEQMRERIANALAASSSTAEEVAQLVEALDRAKEQLDEDCFTTESKDACLARINAVLAPYTRARYARSALKETPVDEEQARLRGRENYLRFKEQESGEKS